MDKTRSWDILLIGGASGSGKTMIARTLARQLELDLVRVDDFQMMLETTTTSISHPAIHYWNTHPNWIDEGVAAAVTHLINVGRELTPGLNAVIADHLEENIPMLLEGDFILPELAASLKSPRVKAIFINEFEKAQILQNYLTREGKLQPYRAEISYAYGEWLAEKCNELGVLTINARPWDTLGERIMEVLVE
ncbi:hypothetical protein [Enterococcus sp. LJL90]